ncbi:acyl-ACP--UDP-N-acetylglucosamine O-acyltransferase [uncultured Helicobacter sp.]|uniref:acyl-ACP--UDP-N-acetylglucosamine O-acyltransferase n=1 Tax=uncultured Helicobacter sp. TaxID=175537 RepID=UPI001C39DDAA|nr:acyl-ACP--UDP-N-acetylglucosamine O-acyltransferase [Candidatus Helicobacter avicola]
MAEDRIAPTSIVESGAKIGKNVKIGHFCVIGKNVVIGDGCEIGDRVTITGSTTLGKNNKIFTGACVGVPPQDLKYAGEDTQLIVGDNNIIREYTTLNTGTIGGGGITRIGDENLFMAYVHIAHDCSVGNGCIFANVATLGGHVQVGNYVNFGGLSAAHQFVKVGDGCMIGGLSALVQDLPPYSIAHGNHARIAGLNKHRMRKLFSREEIDSITALYRRIYSREAPMKELVQRELDSGTLSQTQISICNFILSATRGIPLGHKGNEQ